MGISHFSGLNVGKGSDIGQILLGSVAVDPASLASGAEAETSITITGALTGAAVVLNPPTAGLTAGIEIVGAYVSAADTVKVRLRNNTGGSVDQASVNMTYLIVNPAS